MTKRKRASGSVTPEPAPEELVTETRIKALETIGEKPANHDEERLADEKRALADLADEVAGPLMSEMGRLDAEHGARMRRYGQLPWHEIRAVCRSGTSQLLARSCEKHITEALDALGRVSSLERAREDIAELTVVGMKYRRHREIRTAILKSRALPQFVLSRIEQIDDAVACLGERVERTKPTLPMTISPMPESDRAASTTFDVFAHEEEDR